MSRWSRARLALPSLLALLVVVGLLALPPAVGTASADTHQDAGFEAGETVFVIELDASGDASWQITERIPLENDTDEAAFSEIADEFESGEFELASVAAIEEAVEGVDQRTDRPMTLSDHDRTSAIEGEGENRTGVLTASFTWENFARMDEDTDDLHIDDVLETEQGLWLPGLTADQQLVIRAPDGYAVLDATVPPQDGELRWEGPTEFDNETLTATFIGDGGGNGTEDDPNGDDDPGNGDDRLGLIGVLFAGIFVVAVAGLLVLYREQLEALLDRGPAEATDGPDEDPAASTDGTDVAEADTDGQRSSGAGEATSAGGAAGATADDESTIDEELLSDEERVERLLERNGGRMKQADIVEETDWSNAKVSQLLSTMEEDGRIDKLRIGRENLISFPDVDVTDPGSDG